MVCEVVGSPGNPPTSAAWPALCSLERGSPTMGLFCESIPGAEESKRQKKMGGNNKNRGKKEDKTLEKVGSKQNEIKEVEREKEKVLNMVYIVFYYEFDAGFT